MSDDDVLFDDDTPAGQRKTRRKTKTRGDGPRVRLTPQQQIEADRYATRDQDGTRVVLVETLRFAVPGWIGKANTWPPGRERLAVLGRWAQDAVGPLIEAGDSALFVEAGAENAAVVFNHLARGLAALSFMPGGVRAFGLVWCHTHSPAGVATAEPMCVRCAP